MDASTSVTNTAVRKQEMEPTGLPALVLGLISHPKAAWTTVRTRHRRHLWLPVLLMVLLTAVGAALYVRADRDYVYAQAMAWYSRQPEGSTRPPELRPIQIDAVTGRAFQHGAGLLVRWSLWTLLLYAGCRLFGTGALATRDALALTLWSWLPYIVRGLLQAMVTAVGGRPIYNQGLSGLLVDATPAALTSFRYVVPTATERTLAALLRGVDIFGVWQLLLVIWGLGAFTQAPPRRTRALALAVWLVALGANVVIA
jgi:hypothetical protein